MSITQNEPRAADSRERLLAAAECLFARKGYDGTSVKDLAEEADVNVSLVSYYFGGKEGLLRACLENFGRGRLEAARRILSPPRSVDDFRLRLRLFFEEILSCQINAPNVTQILNRDCTLERPEVREAFRSTFFKAFETLVDFFKAARESGVLRADLDSQLAAALSFGGLLHVMRQAHFNAAVGFSFREPESRSRLIDSIVQFCLWGCVAQPEAKGVTP